MAITPTTIVGNLTADPQLKFTTSQKPQLTFSVAVNDSYTNQDGDKVEKTAYFNVVAWGYTAENAANILEKGMGVIVVGTLDQRSWDDKETGQKRSTVEIKAMEIGARVGSLESVTRRKALQQDSSLRGDLVKPKRTKETVPADDPF